LTAVVSISHVGSSGRRSRPRSMASPPLGARLPAQASGPAQASKPAQAGRMKHSRPPSRGVTVPSGSARCFSGGSACRSSVARVDSILGKPFRVALDPFRGRLRRPPARCRAPARPTQSPPNSPARRGPRGRLCGNGASAPERCPARRERERADHGSHRVSTGSRLPARLSNGHGAHHLRLLPKARAALCR
jgi:hypothetical protein